MQISFELRLLNKDNIVQSLQERPRGGSPFSGSETTARVHGGRSSIRNILSFVGWWVGARTYRHSGSVIRITFLQIIQERTDVEGGRVWLKEFGKWITMLSTEWPSPLVRSSWQTDRPCVIRTLMRTDVVETSSVLSVCLSNKFSCANYLWPRSSGLSVLNHTNWSILLWRLMEIILNFYPVELIQILQN